MAEAVFRIPSKMITYGYVEISVPAGDASPEMLAAQYVNYVHAFQKEEQATVDRIATGLSAPVTASQDADMVEAHEILAKGLGGVTEIPEGAVYAHAPDDVVNALEDARDDVAQAKSAPWMQETKPVPKKPWEKGAPSTAIDVTPDW